MKVTSIIITILTIGSACALSAAVNAKSYSRVDKDGMIVASEAWNASFMKSVDADKNGKITPDEAEAYHLRIAAKVDNDNDGFITIDELNPKK